jgi:hypothetical protein
MNDTQLLAEELAFKMAMRFQIPGMSWGFGRVLESVPLVEWHDKDLDLLELYTLVLMPVALVYSQTGKSI